MPSLTSRQASSASTFKKRKAPRAEAEPSASAPKAGPSTPKAHFQQQLTEIQSSLSDSSDLNPIADLINLIGEKAFDMPSDVAVPSLTILVRTLSHLMANGILIATPSSPTTGLLLTLPPDDVNAALAQEQVQNWLKERFNGAVQVVVRVMLTHPKEKTRVAALTGLMQLQKATSEALSLSEGIATWADCPWRVIVNALVLGQYQGLTGELLHHETLCPEVRATFILDHIEKFADTKLAFYRALQNLLKVARAPRSAVLTILLHLTNPPATRAAVTKSPFWVDALASPPALQPFGPSAGKKAKTSRKGGNKIRQDGDESDEDEEEDLDWFSDSEAEDESSHGVGSAKDQRGNGTQHSDPVSGPKTKRRRRGAGNLVFHQALYEIKAWKVAVDSIWLAILLHRSPKNDLRDDLESGADSGAVDSLSLAEINTVLRVMEKKILPYLSKPQLVADWLLDCLDVGGSTALLSLSPLYKLYVSHSLSLPSLYSTLYTLLTPYLLHSPHRSHSMRLLALFLSSQKLPLALVLAFVKRLSRCALRGPPGGIIPVAVMVYNLLKTHKEGMTILHQDLEFKDPQGWRDPYLSSLQIPPSSTKAQDSSLFEVTTLGATPQSSSSIEGAQERLESHYHAPTTTILRILAQPFTKESYSLEEFLDHSYGSLFETEVARTLKGVNGKKRQREPAVRFSLASESGKRVRVFPQQTQQPPSQPQKAEGEGAGAEARAQRENSVSYEGLDAEEIEAHEAMREVERARDGSAKAQPGDDSVGSKARRRDPLTLWSY